MEPDRIQVNFRTDRVTKTLIEQLQIDLVSEIGLELSISDVLRLAVQALREKYPTHAMKKLAAKKAASP